MSVDTKKLALIKKGDSKAVEEIIEEYRLMIYSIINNYELEYGDYIISKDDLFQEGCIGLIEACKSYRDNDNTKFSTFAFVVIERRIKRSFFKMIRPYQKEYSFDKFTLLDHVESFRTPTVSDKDICYLTENVENELEKLKYITELDKKIIELRVQNYTYREIAKKLNIPVKKVDNRLSRLKRLGKNRKWRNNSLILEKYHNPKIFYRM